MIPSVIVGKLRDAEEAVLTVVLGQERSETFVEKRKLSRGEAEQEHDCKGSLGRLVNAADAQSDSCQQKNRIRVLIITMDDMKIGENQKWCSERQQNGQRYSGCT